MTEEILKSIHAELVAIRKRLERTNTAAPSSSPPQRGSSGGQLSGSGENAEIPQPTSLVDNPSDVQVHFGKNNGVPLGQLSERSLSFYASVKAPRLDNSGKPFPPRPQDVALENAARQLWHDKKGTLAGSPTAAPQRSTEPKPAPHENLDEDVPF